MRNIAGAPIEEADEQCRTELRAAHIQATKMSFVRDGEVKTHYVGSLDPTGWGFQRAWYYWVATGPGIPLAEAEEFDKQWGEVVRASGDCACRGPRFWNKGFGTGNYHIDTQDGLEAFAALVRRISLVDVPMESE